MDNKEFYSVLSSKIKASLIATHIHVISVTKSILCWVVFSLLHNITQYKGITLYNDISVFAQYSTNLLLSSIYAIYWSNTSSKQTTLTLVVHFVVTMEDKFPSLNPTSASQMKDRTTKQPQIGQWRKLSAVVYGAMSSDISMWAICNCYKWQFNSRAWHCPVPTNNETCIICSYKLLPQRNRLGHEKYNAKFLERSIWE